MNKMISVSVSEFLTPELAERIANAEWHRPDWVESVLLLLYGGKTQTDCFNIIAEDENGNIVGRIFCLQNDTNKNLWYYGDLFVAPEYRRQGIAVRMAELMEQTLFDKWCTVVCAYVEPDNIPSVCLQKKLGFEEKPFRKFNNLINDGRIMFEKSLTPFYAKEIAVDDARFVTMFYGKNIEAFHGNEITYEEWRGCLSANDTDEKHFLIQKGALPCAWLKINGLDNEDNIGWISMLAVEPAFKRRGIGEYAVRFAEDYLYKAGKSAVRILTTEDNIPAQELYKKCGFTVLEHCDYFTGDCVKRKGLVFEKIL